MKKSVLLGLALLAFGGSSAVAQEVVYVPDCSQGLLINKNTSNWFITLQGGANMLFGKGDIHAAIKDRIEGQGAIYVGKWVTPTFGFRFGANYKMTKGATDRHDEQATFWKQNDPRFLVKDDKVQEGWYAQKWMGLGPEFDVMINLTNWWCGYRPGRVYNAVLHGGAGAYWRWYRGYEDHIVGQGDLKWRNDHNTVMFATLGLQNNFRLSKHVDFFIDLQYQLIDDFEVEHAADVNLGFTFNLGQTGWDCPVTAVCPTWKYTDAEGDALVQAVEMQNAEINSLKKALADCQEALKNKPAPEAPKVIKVTEKLNVCHSLITVYFPIGQSSLSQREQIVLKAVADVIKSQGPDQVYSLVGWADSYTGTANINDGLRLKRVDTVKNYLVKCGVNPNQLDTSTNAADLTNYGEVGAPLDRAVTIDLK